MRRFLPLLIGLALAWAQPVVQVQLSGSPDAVQNSLEAALKAAGLAVEKSLDISHSLAGRGVRFMPFRVFLLRPEGAVQNAIKLNPALATILPPAIVLYAPSATQAVLAAMDIRLWLPAMKLPEAQAKALQTHYEQVEAALARLGRLERLPSKTVLPSTALRYRLSDSTLAQIGPFLDSVVREKNLNLIGGLRFESGAQQFWICRLEWAELFFGLYPSAGVIAPCRIFAYQDGKDVVMGAIDPSIIEAFGSLTPRAKEEIGRIKKLMDSIFEELGAEGIK